MTYFNRRNEYTVEYSGHEEMSKALCDRIALILDKFVGRNDPYASGIYFIDKRSFLHKIEMEFPGRGLSSVMSNDNFFEVFTVVEIFLEASGVLSSSRKREVFREMQEAFDLSGSVYLITEIGRVELRVDSDLAEKIESMKTILAPHEEFYERFFQAVGNLLGRKAKPEDVVKDVYVAVEGYMKKVTNTQRFGDAIKRLFKEKKIGKEQKKVLEALQEFRSDSDGAGHAGNSKTPNEEEALWFLDTIVAQMRMIDRTTKQL